MTWENLENLLNQLFTQLNQQNSVASPEEIWNHYQAQIQPLLSEYPEEFVELSPGLWLPKAIETARILSKLRQRFSRDKPGRSLTGRIRAEVLLRQRPVRNTNIGRISGEEREVANIAANLPRPIQNFSQFQIEGWSETLRVIRNQQGMVVVAPTGSGKTEVFLLPLIYEIARQIQQNPDCCPRFILLYPRVALLKDQLSRIFRYVYQAEQNQLGSGQLELFSNSTQISHNIIIGFQFSGVASEAKYTLENPDLFENKTKFKLLQDECCPICNQGDLIYEKPRRRVGQLRCNNTNCSAVFNVSIAKKDHATYEPHILVTTAESLDRLYLNPKPEFENYLSSLTGVVFDEVHLYHSLYGAHIHHLIQRLENLCGHSLVKIAASATVANPERFASKFFYGNEDSCITLHSASGYPSEASGLEVLYFLQSPEEENRVGAAPTLIQSTMAMGHGLFLDRPNQLGDRAIIFSESLDLANRLSSQIQDAENRLNLWEFRTTLEELQFQEQNCPNTNPASCLSHYLEGECWRGILGGVNCTRNIEGLRERNLDINYVSSQQRNSYLDGDIVVATPSLDVGVDDERIVATLHYRPPRTVFSFIQRRGRAGRSANTVAYTLLIVANSANDHFYFFRRNRLIRGNYELPLNPQNSVLVAMHQRIADERSRMSELVQQQSGKVQKPILDWIGEKLTECSIIQNHYQDWLNEYGNVSNNGERQRALKTWITEQKQRFEAYLNLRWTLQDIENEAPDILSEPVRETFSLIKSYLDGNTQIRDTIRNQLIEISNQLNTLIYEEDDVNYIKELRELSQNLVTIWQQLQEKVEFGICFEQADGLYNFFHTLEKFREQGKALWILNSAPDVIKTVLQALFYLSESNIDFFIPDAYFNEVKPIIVAVRTRRNRINLKQEDTTKLSTLLIPYRTAYRYHAHPYLSVVETEHNPQWVEAQWGAENGVVGVRLLGEGLHNDAPADFRPEKLYVKALRGDNQGKQVVKMCPQCFATYDESRRGSCHGVQPRPVRLYAEANIERIYSYEPENLIQISSTLQLVTELKSEITVHGSIARVQEQVWNIQKGEYFTRNGSIAWNFEARYVDNNGNSEPVRYGLPTTGIVWNLQAIVDNLLQNQQLENQIEAIEIDGESKEFNSRLILHTASHMLQKAIASISGVNEETLEYCFREDIGEVVVWERYEGGSGISQVFVEALRENPSEVHQEFLASVLCPVNLAERTDWSTPEELSNQLIETWNLNESSLEFINAIVNEAYGERQVHQSLNGNEDREVQVPLQCQRLDGCPACLHTNNCTERFEQPQAVSHLIAEALMRELGQNL